MSAESIPEIVTFHQCIREARKRLNFATAKEFHRNKKDVISMSYESYANIEAGKYLPPADKLTALATALEIQDVKTFVFIYCQTLMPNDLFKSFFSDAAGNGASLILKSDSYIDYKEKFQELLKFNRMQSKYELTEDQIRYLETDVVGWDIVNLFVSLGDEGLSLQEIAEKTDSGIESTKKRVLELLRVGMLKEIPGSEVGDASTRYLVTQDSFVIPRRPVADQLTFELVRRDVDHCYKDKRNRPYTRFRLMPIDPNDRETIETFIDNFVLDSRRFRKIGGKTHYLQILFSDRNDLL